MACFKPLRAYRGAVLPSGKRAVVFDAADARGPEFQLPCGQCRGCRLEKSRQWAMRCVHEAQLHEENCFLTLTYRDECLPKDGSLEKRDFVNFMKRFRKAIEPRKIRYFMCGEYGERFCRPHYHACVFGFDFADKVLYRQVNGCSLYTSEFLAALWPAGFSTIGSVTFESAAYVARYVMKKYTGEFAKEHYLVVDYSTGEVSERDGELACRVPEYATMSRGGRDAKGRNGGIGARWYELYGRDVYPRDEVIVRGIPVRPPRFYDELFSAAHGDVFKEVKAKRLAKMKPEENTPERLRVREICLAARLNLLRRDGVEGLGEPASEARQVPLL